MSRETSDETGAFRARGEGLEESDDVDVRDHRTERWQGIGGFALFAAGVGALAGSPGLVLAAAVGAAYAGYAGTIDPPAVSTEGGLRIERHLDDPEPVAGETVRVRVALHNDTEGFLPDVRVVDGVPPGLDVVEGSPRHGAALRPGATAVFSYEVRAMRGTHRFQPAQVVVADPSGEIERETTVSAATEIRCRLSLSAIEDLPLRGVSSPAAGRVETDAGGAGVEFHATREYHAGDPLNRIDWNRKAKLGELGTLEYRQERAATVALVVDVRRAAYRAPSPRAPHAVERSVDAAGRVFATLLDAGDHVGLASFGNPGAECWLAPALGHDQRARGRELLTDHPAFDPMPPESDMYASLREDRREELRERLVDRLHDRLAPNTQVFLLSPCCDAFPAEMARRLEAHGRAVTVVSPDPTTDETPLRDLLRMERADRIRDLRRAGIRVVDWSADESLARAVARARERWVS